MGYPTVYPTGVTVYDPERAFRGYTLFQAAGVGALLIDMSGREVQLWKGLQGFPNKLLPGGQVFGSTGERDPRHGFQDQVDLVQVVALRVSRRRARTARSASRRKTRDRRASALEGRLRRGDTGRARSPRNGGSRAERIEARRLEPLSVLHEVICPYAAPEFPPRRAAVPLLPWPRVAWKYPISVPRTRAPVEQPKKARSRPTAVSGDDVGAATLGRQVAESLKRLRAERRLSLDELAVTSGVSRAALSQIEGARTNPTLSVLWKVAVGLGVPFQTLLGRQDADSARVLRAGDAAPLRSADGRMESRLLSPAGAAQNVDVYDLRFLPKGLHRSEPHAAGTVETLLVLTGSMRISVRDEVHDLSPGDTIFFHADAPHSYENRSSHEARCVNIVVYGR